MKQYNTKMNDVVVMSSDAFDKMIKDIKKSEINKTYAGLLTAGVLLYGVYKFYQKKQDEQFCNEFDDDF